MRSLRIATAVLVLAGSSCRNDSGAVGTGVHVVASFYPLAFVAGEVGGNLVEVDNLTPPGAEPHDLELTPDQVRALADADLVLYLDQGFQPSVEDAVGDVGGRVVDALSTQGGLHPGGDEGGAVDPHVWLDPQRLADIVAVVGDLVATIDPDNAEAYRGNATDLQAKLDSLDAEFKDGLAHCERDSIVTSHEAFGYLAEAYGLEQVGIAGLDPEAEPSPKRLADVADFVTANGVTTIFFEVLVSPDIAETLADEANVTAARLDPLEGMPEDGDYFTAMRANLDALREALGCT